ncbi:unnamed protein product, partial [Protopolystoma xenopodis]
MKLSNTQPGHLALRASERQFFDWPVRLSILRPAAHRLELIEAWQPSLTSFASRLDSLLVRSSFPSLLSAAFREGPSSAGPPALARQARPGYCSPDAEAVACLLPRPEETVRRPGHSNGEATATATATVTTKTGNEAEAEAEAEAEEAGRHHVFLGSAGAEKTEWRPEPTESSGWSRPLHAVYGQLPRRLGNVYSPPVTSSQTRRQQAMVAVATAGQARSGPDGGMLKSQTSGLDTAADSLGGLLAASRRAEPSLLIGASAERETASLTGQSAVAGTATATATVTSTAEDEEEGFEAAS